ncbi:MAG: ion transporter [Pseudanabaena sp. M135S2SP2A07QC]|jgi:voltage-gated potassium channel|nr:ion transporter [Pseudanabaena sp. M090S1SP2A07QC]MCA6504890.1 ion transporter [Pseudanabaena sp. M172S2SP2A07QC]MCA6511047.1 ion transporter [Pseudanabaena sp. M109S1SP2A07QC]MCA6522129.1 ion transporter [Pseudanabaena sp. M051S1SP2A07QC]MCA6524723.1 ion transporter [Pseudanabaena sp. M179S2SP2A07QC]MCA6528898.1 ion transporter [Pseudanabaena sp. M125S2SP2A07QC]MCA6534730.1 ion transporter [Pseudanabaena sp. M176S2SP2A07QC]MCA6540980.1 ion transporter [Pseudanabaena sp. M037S2SP2A07QC]M
MLRQKISQKINFYLDDLATPVGKLINIAIAILVLASAISFVAQTYEISDVTRHRLNLLDDIILGVFVFEYFLRLICAEEKLKHLFSLYAIIDLVAILPFFLGAIDVTFIRLLRWFRILRLIRLVESRTLFAHKTEDIAILFRILFTLLAIVFVFSGLVYQIEHPSNPKFHTFLDAFYFSIFTMTTVGYSDVMPKSDAGKLTTVIMVLTGIALIPVQLGELFKRLVQTANQSDRENDVMKESICSGCELSLHDMDAEFCKVCGTKL